MILNETALNIAINESHFDIAKLLLSLDNIDVNAMNGIQI